MPTLYGCLQRGELARRQRIALRRAERLLRAVVEDEAAPREDSWVVDPAVRLVRVVRRRPSGRDCFCSPKRADSREMGRCKPPRQGTLTASDHAARPAMQPSGLNAWLGLGLGVGVRGCSRAG